MEVGYITLTITSPEFKKDYDVAKAKLLEANLAGFVTRITAEQYIKENQLTNVSMRWEKLQTF